MSRSAGPGYPAWCRCVKCRSSLRCYLYDSQPMRGTLGRLTPTGRYKQLTQPRGGPRHNTWFAIEYTCGDCGHVGWTRHNDMVRKFRDAGHILPER